jgi:hypothetical protein
MPPGKGVVGVGKARHHDDLVHNHHLGDGVGHGVLLGLAVDGHDFHGRAANAAGGVDLIGRHLEAVEGRLIQRSLAAGQVVDRADLDGVRQRGAASAAVSKSASNRDRRPLHSH